MVPVASSSEMVAPPVASVSFTRKVSSPSWRLSSAVATVKVWVVTPMAKERVRAVVTAV